MSKMEYCGNCKQWITPTKGINWLLAVILLMLFVVPGVIYIIWAASKGGKCPMCNSNNWSIPPKEEEKKE